MSMQRERVQEKELIDFLDMRQSNALMIVITCWKGPSKWTALYYKTFIIDCCNSGRSHYFQMQFKSCNGRFEFAFRYRELTRSLVCVSVWEYWCRTTSFTLAFSRNFRSLKQHAPELSWGIGATAACLLKRNLFVEAKTSSVAAQLHAISRATATLESRLLREYG